MLNVSATPDRRARCLSHDDKPAPPLELVAALEEEERWAAWAMLQALARQPPGGL